jgi:hypothetical protein
LTATSSGSTVDFSGAMGRPGAVPAQEGDVFRRSMGVPGVTVVAALGVFDAFAGAASASVSQHASWYGPATLPSGLTHGGGGGGAGMGGAIYNLGLETLNDVTRTSNTPY